MNFIEIDGYREFIREFLKRKSPKARGEIAKLADHIGVHPTFVSQVLAGNKDFNLEQSFAVTSYLSLTEVEKKYFLCLVQKDRAGTRDLKAFFQEELKTLRKSLLSVASRISTHKTLDDSQKAIFYSSWLYSAIRLFCSVGKGKTLEEISERFRINRVKVSGIMDFLIETGLCVADGDVFTMGPQHTHAEATGPFILRHHMNWRSKATQRHEDVSKEELVLTAPMSVSAKDFQKIREILLASVKESFEVAKASPAEEVAFLTIDFLWLEPKNDK